MSQYLQDLDEIEREERGDPPYGHPVGSILVMLMLICAIGITVLHHCGY